jgi:hypothetical protein
LDLGLERNVRLRLFGVPEALVNPLLDIDDLDDERWAEILPRAGVMVGTVRTLQAIHLLTGRSAPAEIRMRLTRRLAAPPTPPAPAPPGAGTPPTNRPAAG